MPLAYKQQVFDTHSLTYPDSKARTLPTCGKTALRDSLRSLFTPPAPPCPAVPCEIDVNHSEAYFSGVAPADGTGVAPVGGTKGVQLACLTSSAL